MCIRDSSNYNRVFRIPQPYYNIFLMTYISIQMRNPKRKTDRGKIPIETFIQTAEAVEKVSSVLEAARQNNICHVTLKRFIERQKKSKISFFLCQ